MCGVFFPWKEEAVSLTLIMTLTLSTESSASPARADQHSAGFLSLCLRTTGWCRPGHMGHPGTAVKSHTEPEPKYQTLHAITSQQLLCSDLKILLVAPDVVL